MSDMNELLNLRIEKKKTRITPMSDHPSAHRIGRRELSSIGESSNSVQT